MPQASPAPIRYRSAENQQASTSSARRERDVLSSVFQLAVIPLCTYPNHTLVFPPSFWSWEEVQALKHVPKSWPFKAKHWNQVKKKWGAVKAERANSLPSSSSLTASASWRKKDVVSQGTAQDFPALLVELVGGWVLGEDKLNVSQQCVLAAAKVNSAPACFSQRVASRPREWPCPLLGTHEAPGAPCPGVGPQAAEAEEDPQKGYQEGYRSGA